MELEDALGLNRYFDARVRSLVPRLQERKLQESMPTQQQKRALFKSICDPRGTKRGVLD